MSQQFLRVCDQCNGAIPSGADQINAVQGYLRINGETVPFPALDFCCTEHMVSWINAHPAIAVPSPAYSPPPALP